MGDTRSINDAARACLSAELCVLPAKRGEKRPAVGRWKQYQKRLPGDTEMAAWLANHPDAMCIVCGKVSSNVEIIDFDGGGELFSAWLERIPDNLRQRLVIETTPSGGRHAIYRCQEPVCGNLKLAQRQDGDRIVTLIETRGEGGLFLCAPTPGYQITQGDLCALPVLSEAERDKLLQTAWDLNEYLPPVVDGPQSSANVGQRTASSGGQSQISAENSHNGHCPSESGDHRPISADNSDICRSASNMADRPGDDFNDRGDVRAILKEHGWTSSGGQENEYWCRPGKKRGWSATLKDRVFYVFSSNAAPFDANQAYSPFSVYALLKHGGDFEQAARSLREQGYGSDEPAQNTSGADIEAIVAMASECRSNPSDDLPPTIADPGPIPERLFSVPGFVSQVMDFTLANAPYPNVGLAFCGAMALQSYLCGRKVCDAGDLRPNIYLLALASSGTGKDFPRKVNSRVLFEIGHVASLGDKFASGEGIQDALARTNAMLFQNDEMDGVLRQINLDRENKRESISNILLTLYTSASDIYPMRVRAGQKEAAHIDQPHLTLFGTATPQYFYESLNQRMLTNGFFARLIIVDIGKRGVGQSAGSARMLPDSVIQTARWWSEFQPGTRRANLLEVHPEPRVVPCTSEAQELVTALQRQTEAEYDKAHERNDEVARVAWSRTHENAKKLALLYACSVNHEDPQIDTAAIEWASEFAKHQTQRQLSLAGSYVAVSDFDGLCKKALRFLARCRESGDAKEYPVPDWRLRRHLGENPTIFKNVTDGLVMQEQIRFDEQPGKTKPRSGWMLK